MPPTKKNCAVEHVGPLIGKNKPPPFVTLYDLVTSASRCHYYVLCVWVRFACCESHAYFTRMFFM